MKTLAINCTYFKLQDDFEGKESDALRLLADYMDSVNFPNKSIDFPDDKKSSEITFEEAMELSWKRYLELKNDMKFVGSIVLDVVP